ncbi:hypothetical protein TrCOL_g12986 [Triparma columacea]|uniref:Uncharacterized protein n=1 Tax=Triparma columacea TaxID=722753 RepID=A0A9W7GBC8_9STRA|nr:hypothetical protein TrCOL_g12986 [Triparma columacea]
MYAPLGKGLVVLSSFLVFLNGIIHVFHNVLNPWCSGQQTCIGPALRWNTGSTGFTSDSNADGWRTVLTTDLNTVLDVWSPILFGFILLSTSSARIRSSRPLIGSIAYSWTRMGTFLLIVALFGSFGYSGNFGIVTGMVCSGSAMYCFAVHFMGFVGGKRPCLNEEGEVSGTPLFDRIMSKRPGAFGSGVKMSQERKAAATSAAKPKRASAAPAKPSKSAYQGGKGPSNKSSVTGKQAYTTTQQFHARYR